MAQSCRAAGHGVAILDCDAQHLTEDQAVAFIEDHDPRLVVFEVYGSEPNQGTVRMTGAVPLAEKLKQHNPRRKTCFVGTHTSALPLEVLALSCVDFVLPNEGVYGLRALLTTDLTNGLADVWGIGWKDGQGDPRLNPIGRIVPQERMDADLPGYAWDLLPKKEKFGDPYRSHFWFGNYEQQERTPYAALYTSIGCPFKCGFCWREGTKVVVANGRNKKVEEITKDDTLVAFDTNTNSVVETRIEQIGSRVVPGYLRIELSDGKVVELTDEHPLYSDGKWVEAKHIRVGDKVLVIDQSDKIGLYRRLYNPMRNKQSRDKVAASKVGDKNPMKRKEVAEKSHRKQAENRAAGGERKKYTLTEEGRRRRKETLDKFYQTEQGIQRRKRASERMKAKNPMQDPEVVRRVGEIYKKKIERGEVVPFLCTPEGKKIIGEIAKEKQSSDLNPMKNPGTAAKMGAMQRARIESGEIVPYSKTPEGKKHIGDVARRRLLSLGEDHPAKKPENRKKQSERVKGPKSRWWKGGISKNEYPEEFNGKLKKKIRVRDNYTCQICGHYGKGGARATAPRMHVHHIDYNKQNSKECNLILLCDSCHAKTTNSKREFWTKALSDKMLQLGYEDCSHYVNVVGVKCIEGETRVYNFQCGPYDNYFANYVLGHNCVINSVNRTDGREGVTAAGSPVFRHWSADRTMKEIDWLASRGVGKIRISDEMFFLRKSHYRPLLEKVREKYGDSLSFWAYARVDTVLPKELELFRSAGVRWLALGIESGDQTVRREVAKGSYKEVNIREVVREVEGAGIRVIANFIAGLPGDTRESLEASLALAMDLNTAMYNLYPAIPLPGSPLYQEAKKAGRPLPDSYDGFGFLSWACTPSGTESLSPADVVRWRDDAFRRYWDRPAFLDKICREDGPEAVRNIQGMLNVRLKRKLLGDPRPE